MNSILNPWLYCVKFQKIRCIFTELRTNNKHREGYRKLSFLDFNQF